MKLHAGFAVVLVGATAVASAEPKQEGDNARVSYRTDLPVQPAHADGAWMELATATPASHGTEYFDVGQDAGTFGQVRIELSKGTVELHRVRLDFADGTSKVVDVDKRLNAHRRSAVIALRSPRPIAEIVVSTERGPGSYEIFAQSEDHIAAR
ncbi:MAG TPA: hypothetical protein VLX92_33035 [Kofleriaceae bacterium]|nr:hypothetical protein [Kofleriaceae bacterium]